jgi:glutaredoxin
MMSKTILPINHPITINTFHHYDSFTEFSDHCLRTKKFRILSITFAIFLFSLWVVAKFSGSGFYIHNLRCHNKHNEAAMAAAAVLGEGGEEGIHGLEVENHGRIGPNGHNHGIHEPLNSNQRHFVFTDLPNIAQQRFEEALKNDLHIEDYYDSEPLTKVELEIDDLVHENPVIIFSKSYCPYSQRANHILSLYHISPNFVVIDVDKRDDADEVKDALIKFTYRNTFPNIFIDGRSIGGSEELAIMHTNGRLKDLLIEVGVLDDYEPSNHDISRPAL